MLNNSAYPRSIVYCVCNKVTAIKLTMFGNDTFAYSYFTITEAF